MRQLLLEKPGEFRWTEIPTPVAGPGEALVRVRRCGVCGTDIHAYAGKQPFFSFPRRLGHELCVEVLEAPAGSALKPGDLCAVEAYLFCGECPACLAGKTNCCQTLKVFGVHIDGGHAPVITVPADKLHVANGLDPDEIALVEPLVIGAHGVERAAIKPGEPVLILGLGPIGLAAGLAARAAGANLVCADVNAGRLAFACETLGLGTPMRADADLVEPLRAHFGRLPAVVIDATGNPASMNGAFKYAEFGGRVVFLGLHPGEVVFEDASFHRRELTLLASRAGLSGTFRDVIRLMREKRLDVLPLITHRFPFAETAGRLPTLHHEPGLVKAMIGFDDEVSSF